MRYIALTTIIFINITMAIGQDCKTLNGFTNFHGIKFGQVFADSVKKYFEKLNTSSSYIDYSLDQKVLQSDVTIFQRFYKWFRFGDNVFQIFTVSCLPDGRVYEFDLAKLFDKEDVSSIEDSIEIINNKLPKTFIKASDEITSLFGKMTKSENKTDILGYHLSQIWDCEKNKIELRLLYNNGQHLFFNLDIGITITDKELEKIQKLENYQN